MKKIEEKVIHLYAIKYYTPDGKETCALDIEKKRMCPFLRTTHFGTTYYCLFNQDESIKTSKEGFLIPVTDCPIVSNYIFINEN